MSGDETKLAAPTNRKVNRIEFSGEKRPTGEQLDDLHLRAHEECFIARSVKTKIRVE